jgi:hypothetical protein
LPAEFAALSSDAWFCDDLCLKFLLIYSKLKPDTDVSRMLNSLAFPFLFADNVELFSNWMLKRIQDVIQLEMRRQQESEF